MKQKKEGTREVEGRISETGEISHDALSSDVSSPEISPVTSGPVHDWEGERTAERDFFDDGTMTYFWRAHTLTTLVFMICFLLYEVFSPPDEDIVDNTKRGLVASVSAFILLGVTVTPDGPFKRPHPAIWRFTFIISIVYELGLIFTLYQSASGARQLLKHIDPKLGEPLEEKDYGGNCRFYDHENPEDPYHNIWWIMDALLCNGLGIYCGLQSLKYFSMKTYHWRGLWNIPTYRGKLRRIIGQFGPYVWVDYDWKPLSSLGRWFSMLGIIAIFLLAELNTFYLKFVLWVAPGHWANLVRLILILPWGAVALREVFQFLDDPDCVKFGRQSWLFLAIVSTELLIVIKFGWETVTIPFPSHVVTLWMAIFLVLVLWTVWNFYIDPHTFKVDSKDIERRREHWSHVRAIETKLSPSESRLFNPQFLFDKFIQKKNKED
ncbi:phosphatidylserine synthase 2-like isoform X2 [Panulirus ornatus]|uniref:phosphatidylserine synthase 2-like isoform X2 n=1 Tax=Panulirus ornatus TaxID=150431 RepID=UPI003A8C2797